MGNRTLVVGQSGGATAVTNATLAGIVSAAQRAGFSRILGMRHGMHGLLQHQFHDLTALSAETLDQLSMTPSAALGTARLNISDDQLGSASDTLAGLDCQDLILIGGNDSADTALRLHQVDPNVRVILAPKTVDNDLPGTDHCPGFSSAAAFRSP